MIREVGLTLWTGDGATKAFEGSRPLLDRARPQFVQLHTDPKALASDAGADLTAAVRKAYPETRVVWAVQGDSYGPDPSKAWADCARAAVANGVGELMLNCEGGWKSPKRGDLNARNAIARKAVEACRKAAPGLALWFTSYDGPVSVVAADGKTRWGGHGSFPWKGFLGTGGCDEFAPQVYVAPKTGLARKGLLADRADRSARSINAAIRTGLIAPTVRRVLYLQAHGVRVADTCAVAMDAARTSLWASPSRIDADGAQALCVLAELARRGQSIREAQAALGLVADGIVGPLTLRAMGIA